MVGIDIDDGPVGKTLSPPISGFPRENVARIRLDGDLLNGKIPCLLDATIHEKVLHPVPRLYRAASIQT